MASSSLEWGMWNQEIMKNKKEVSHKIIAALTSPLSLHQSLILLGLLQCHPLLWEGELLPLPPPELRILDKQTQQSHIRNLTSLKYLYKSCKSQM